MSCLSYHPVPDASADRAGVFRFPPAAPVVAITDPLSPRVRLAPDNEQVVEVGLEVLVTRNDGLEMNDGKAM